jgi:hypothetical protein
VIAGVLAGILGMRLGLGDAVGIVIAVPIALATVTLQLLYQYRGVVRPRGAGAAGVRDRTTRP